jgi:hypothetical protein
MPRHLSQCNKGPMEWLDFLPAALAIGMLVAAAIVFLQA